MKKLFSTAIIVILLLQMILVAWAWEIERPGDEIDIREKMENSKTDGKASVGLGVATEYYLPNVGDYQGHDCVTLNMSMTANSRKGLTYTCVNENLWWINENELLNKTTMVGIGDNVVVPFDIPQYSEAGSFSIRFYGGRWSGEYKKLYISSNGFVSFDNSTQASPTPSNIPSSAKPNAFVAAVWSDLKVDSSASIVTGFWAMYSIWHFMIIWKNVLHKATNKTLTFGIIFQDAPGFYPEIGRYSQSQIWISYQNVSNISTSFTCGVEDQEGRKGLGGLCSGSSLGSSNGTTLRFYQDSNSYFLKRLIINFSDTNQKTRLQIDEDNSMIRGLNIQRDYEKEFSPDSNLGWIYVLLQVGTLLLGKAGLLLEVAFITMEAVDLLAYNQFSGRKVDVNDLDDNKNQTASIKALTYQYAVDAILSIGVDWVLDTPKTSGNHSLTINATAEYYEISIIDGSITTPPPISTTVNLNIGPDDNNNRGTADPIQIGVIYSRFYIGGYDQKDFYKTYISEGTGFYMHAQADTSHGTDKPLFSLHLYAPGEVYPRVSTAASLLSHIEYTADISGDWCVEARIYENHGFYSLWVGFIVGGGGCPTLFVWNGSQFADEGVLNIHSEPDVDVIVNHTLQTIPAAQNFIYTLKLAEIAYGYNYSHSFIDQVKLYAIDNNGKAHQCWLLYANHSRLGNVWQQLFFSDDDRTETYKDEEITLKFLKPFWIQNPKTFIFQIEGHNPEKE